MAQAPTTALDEDPVTRHERMAAMAQPAPNAGNLVKRETLDVSTASVIWGTTVTAKRVEVERDEQKILAKIKTRAAAAGDEWFYRFPVKKKGGGTDWIEGPSIKCAMAVASVYGNCEVDARVIDGGDVWLIYARFADHETGFSVIRPFQGDKSASRLGGDDEKRRRDAAFGIAVSKAERNVVVNALESFCWFGFEEAKKNLVDQVGKNIERYRSRLIERFAALPLPIARVEAQVGRAVKDWLAADIARVIAELQAVKDGMATADETWPAPGADEPRRENVTDVEDTSAQAQPAASGSESKASHPLGEASHQSQPQSSSPPPVNDDEWRVPENIVGQANVIASLIIRLQQARELVHVEAIERVNAERIAKITGVKRAELDASFQAKREQLGTKP